MTATSIPDNRETIIDVDDKEAKAEDNREAKNNEKTVLGTEYPMVITKYDYINNIDIPNMEICSSGFFEILRCDTKFNNQTEIQNGCQKYISSPNVTEGGGDRKRCHTFKANKDIQYILGNPNGLKKLKFYYKIDNATDAVRENIGVPLINIRIFSPDLLDVSEMDKAVRSRLDLDWNFIPGIIGHVSLIKFKTSIYKSIPPRDVSAIIGLGPNYAITRRYDCIVNYFPFDQNPPPMPDGTNGYFSVAAGDFVQEEISEKRTTTILSTIASAGGAFGVIGAILVCLFGSRILDPWGIARKIAVNPWYLKDILVDFGYKMIGKQPKSSTDILNDEQLNAAIPRKFLDTSFLSNS
ncbi:10965_t:CDS:2 [Entrophospora sp. SA101]|nr:10962_t:CDS:2 [Entrophospora sp. SA101]CAJ0833183.1 10965_t:CDS:2 [Entrophospora sp. SA101]